MFRDVLASLLCLIVLAGCGETQHPVRQETLAPPVDEPEETGDEVAAGPSGPVEDGPSLAPGHPPMPPMAPARVEMKVTAPEGWKAVQPRSRMIQAEFALPKAENDEADGRLTVTVAGGSIEANVDRWRGQFEDLEEKPVEEIDVSGTKVTLVDFSGTYNERRGMMGPVTPRSGYRMLGAIIALPDEMVFVKGYGPQATMAQYVEDFRAFVESLASSDKTE